jgi:hypothetical protein
MGMFNELFVGPYAAWRVDVPETEEDFIRTAAWQSIVGEGVLDWKNYLGDHPGTKRCAAEHGHHVFMPRSERPGKPQRPMRFGDKGCFGLEILDLTDVDRQAEIAWFADKFRPELRKLAEYFGSEPLLRWGAVESIS